MLLGLASRVFKIPQTVPSLVLYRGWEVQDPVSAGVRAIFWFLTFLGKNGGFSSPACFGFHSKELSIVLHNTSFTQNRQIFYCRFQLGKCYLCEPSTTFFIPLPLMMNVVFQQTLHSTPQRMFYLALFKVSLLKPQIRDQKGVCRRQTCWCAYARQTTMKGKLWVCCRISDFSVVSPVCSHLSTVLAEVCDKSCCKGTTLAIILQIPTGVPGCTKFHEI